MIAIIKLYRPDGPSKKGWPVKLILTHSGKQRRVTLYHTELDQWDPVQELPRRTHQAFVSIVSEILNLRAAALDPKFTRITDFDEAKRFLLEKEETREQKAREKKAKSNFYAWAEECVQEMNRRGRKGNADSYAYAVQQLKYFAPQLDFDDITPTLLQRFKQYKLSSNARSTVRAYLAAIRTIYNQAVSVGRCENREPFEGLFKDIGIRKRRQKQRYLPQEALWKLEGLKFPQMGLQRAVDLSMLQFYMAGLDLMDVYFLEWDDIVNGRVILMRSKLGDRAYEFDVKLLPKAEAILKKYAAPEGKYVFPWRKTHTAYDTFYRRHLRHLETVQERAKLKLAPKNDKLTTKVMRHTFATFGKFAGVEEDVLRELMGHERNDIDTVYKDKYPEEIRDAAQLKITGELAAVEKRKVTGRKVVRRTLVKSRGD